jgi:hypothetical protein
LEGDVENFETNRQKKFEKACLHVLELRKLMADLNASDGVAILAYLQARFIDNISEGCPDEHVSRAIDEISSKVAELQMAQFGKNA